MKRHKFTKWNKERLSVYASAILILAVCVVSGIYAQSKSPSRTQIIDIPVQQEGVAEEETGNDTASADVQESVPVTATEQKPIAVEEPEITGEVSMDLTGDAELAENQAENFVNPEPAETVRVKEAAHFSPEDGISWPVIGNVIMNYSMDERTYFATLNQYCYYPAVAISAQTDAPVSAAAAGEVVKKGINEEIGQYVIADLGDGYQATYGQLKDITVEVGDVVSRSQIIGYVAEPTKYYSLEGTNVYFKLEKDGEPMNPVTYFN